MTKYLILLIWIISACRENPQKKQLVRPKKNNQARTLPKLIETFTDSTNIGRENFNKFELKRYAVADSNYITIRFYSKRNNKWQIKNEFHFSKDVIAGCDPAISDFNNDGLNDVTYVSNIAARGANDVRTLFVYDKQNDKLIHIKNSEDFPNMLYNQELNCIDAFLVSGCYTTVFLKLEADSLREFASVDQCDSLTVTMYDRYGNEKLLQKKPLVNDDINRYKNFNPLEEYSDNQP